MSQHMTHTKQGNQSRQYVTRCLDSGLACAVEPLNNGHTGKDFVNYREVVLF